MATIPLVLGIAVVIAAPTAAFVLTNEYHDLQGQGCAAAPTVSYEEPDRVMVQVRIINLAEAANLRACVTDSTGTERHQESVELGAGDTHVMRVNLPASTTRVSLELDRPGYEYTAPIYAIVGTGWAIPDCSKGIPDLVARTEFSGYGSGIWGVKGVCALDPA